MKLLFLVCSLLGLALTARAQVVLSGAPYGQDFNTLATTGTSSSVPAGWAFLETGANANGTYTAADGTLNAGDTYSFGTGTAVDRAFGTLQSGNLISVFGASFFNNTGASISALLISYAGEQWRLGTLGRIDQLDFQYSTNATSLSNGTWIDFNSLDFTAPVTTGAVGPLNGNANSTAISSTITGLNRGAGTNDLDSMDGLQRRQRRRRLRRR